MHVTTNNTSEFHDHFELNFNINIIPAVNPYITIKIIIYKPSCLYCSEKKKQIYLQASKTLKPNCKSIQKRTDIMKHGKNNLKPKAYH